MQKKWTLGWLISNKSKSNRTISSYGRKQTFKRIKEFNLKYKEPAAFEDDIRRVHERTLSPISGRCSI